MSLFGYGFGFVSQTSSRFSPKNASNLSLWLDAQDSSNYVLSGSNLVRWNNKVNGTVTKVVPTGSNIPILSVGGLNGFDAFDFDRPNPTCICRNDADANVTPLTTYPMTVYIVCIIQTNSGTLFYTGDTDLFECGFDTFTSRFRAIARQGTDDIVRTTSNQSFGTPYIASFYFRNPTDRRVAANNSFEGTSTVSKTSSGFTIGVMGGGFDGLNARVGEYLVYNSDLYGSVSDSLILSYLSTKWNISI